MNLKIYTSAAKRLKLKVRKFWELTPTSVDVRWKKLVETLFFSRPTLIGLKRRTLCFRSCKNRKLRLKPWSVATRERKKSFFFPTSILLKEIFWSVCILSQRMERWINFRKTYFFTNGITSYRIYKKQKDSLEGSLDRALLVVELNFPKILVRRLPLHTSNVNNEFTGRSKQLYSLCDQPLGAPIMLLLWFWY